MGVDDEGYGTIRSNILSSELFLNLNKVYTMIIQQERVRIMIRGREESGILMSFIIKVNVLIRISRYKAKDKSVCKFYNCIRYDEDRSFQLIGQSDWWGERLYI